MSYKILLVIIFLFTVLYGCHGDSTFTPNFAIPDSLFKKSENFAEIDVFSVEKKPLILDSLNAKIKFIPLQSTLHAYSKRVDNLMVSDSLILINTRSSILFFNREGKFLQRYKNIGRGPSEYTTIEGFAVSFKNDLMAIADQQFIKLYNLKAKFIKATKLPTLSFTLSPIMGFLTKSKLLVENARVLPQYKKGYSPLWMLNLQTGKAHPLFPKNYPSSTKRFHEKFVFEGQLYHFGGEYRYMSRDSYNIYNINKSGKVTLVYKLDFGKNQMPVGAIYDATHFRELRDRYAIIWNLFETKNYLFLKYTRGAGLQNDQHTGYVVYDKQKRKVVAHQFKTKGLQSKKYPGLSFWPSYVTKDGKLVCIFTAAEIAKANAIRGIGKDDNKVLAIITLKGGN